MQLLKPDLCRSFVIGFAIGAAALVATMAAQTSPRGLAGAMIPAAEAASVLPDQTR